MLLGTCSSIDATFCTLLLLSVASSAGTSMLSGVSRQLGRLGFGGRPLGQGSVCRIAALPTVSQRIRDSFACDVE